MASVRPHPRVIIAMTFMGYGRRRRMHRLERVLHAFDEDLIIASVMAGF
jgi:hypothetical protein